jgi:hypothetical protein
LMLCVRCLLMMRKNHQSALFKGIAGHDVDTNVDLCYNRCANHPCAV